MRTAGTIAGIMAILTLLSAGTVVAASRAERATTVIVADVEGRPIKSELIPEFYCHDFDFPRIHCFRTAAGLERATKQAVASQARTSTAPGNTAFGSGDYVTIYDGAYYSGSYMNLSQNYDALWWIGWNDRISSYQARNSASGTFWSDWFASGTARNFCCNTNVSSLPSGLDDAFSSVYRH